MALTHRVRRLPVWLAALIGAAALGGCDLEWAKPEVSVPPPERLREAKPIPSDPIPSGADFAAKFGSRELTGLVAQALEDNLDLAAALARIDQADAQARVSSAALWPSVTMNNLAQASRIPGTRANAAPNFNPAANFLNAIGNKRAADLVANQAVFSSTHPSLFSLGLNASYEIDFWGKNEDASKAGRLLANASRFDRDVVEISTVAAVLNAYLQVLNAQDRLRIANDNVKIADHVFQAIKARLEVGTATALDYAQQETVLAQQRASIPPLEQTLRQTKNTLAVLLGRTPESFNIRGGALTALTFPRMSPGLPSEVLLRRPDVAEAEAKLASQEFSVLQARAAFFPSFTLTGQYGVQSIVLKNLLRPEAIAYQLAANMAQPLLDGYNLQGQYDLQKGKYAELAADYKKQILTALSDTENAIIAVRETERQMTLQAVAVGASKRALEAAQARLHEGTIDIVTLSTTETTYFQNQDILAQVRLSHFQAAVTLYQALGGGWSPTTRQAEIARADEAYESYKGPWP